MNGVVTTYDEKYKKEPKVTNQIEAFIRSMILHKTLESISFDYRRRSEDRKAEDKNMQEVIERLSDAQITSTIL